MSRIVLLLLGTLLAVACSEAPDRPHVVLLVMDTTRGDRCSLNGYGRETTPNLTRFATDATVYRDAWSPAGWTAPAHASLFTGQRPENHGFLRGNREFLLPESDTLAELLGRAGYRNACFTNNLSLSPNNGLVQGFERVEALYLDDERPYPWAVQTHGLALEWALDVHRSGERFFLFVNDMEPHYPYTPPSEQEERFRRPGTPADLVAWGPTLSMREMVGHNYGIERLSREQLDRVSDLYDAEIATLDRTLGILIEGLRAEGILDETVFVIAGDHGENLGDHGLVDHLFSLHRSICHVPLIIRYPPRFTPGRQVKDVVRLEDVSPTILELCGVPVPDGLDGRSLLSELPGRVAKAALGPPIEYLEHLRRIRELNVDTRPFEAELRSVYDGRHHLIRYSDGREELYDVSVDPLEKRNLVAEEREVLRRLRGLLVSDPDAGAAGSR